MSQGQRGCRGLLPWGWVLPLTKPHSCSAPPLGWSGQGHTPGDLGTEPVILGPERGQQPELCGGRPSQAARQFLSSAPCLPTALPAHAPRLAGADPAPQGPSECAMWGWQSSRA